MSAMTSAERVMCVLRRGQPDRIPHFEWIIDRKVRHAICPGSTLEEFTLRMGLDATLTAPDIRKETIGPKRYRNEWGVVSEDTVEEHAFPVEGPILSSSNSIHSAVKPGNYLAMWNAIHTYGRYPLALDAWADSGAVEAFS